MSRSGLASVLVLLGTLTFLTTAGLAHRASARATKAAEHLRARRDRLKCEIAALRENAKLANKAGTSRAEGATENPKETAAKPEQKAAAAGESFVSIEERLRTDPEAQVYWLRTQKAELTGKYGSLYRKLRLTKDQIAGFEQICTDREEKNMDLSALARTQAEKTGTITQELGMAINAVEPEYQRRMRELLGDGGYQQLQEYQHTLAARELVNGLAGMAVVVGHEPLTAQQGEQLVQVITAAIEQKRSGIASDVDWSRIDSQMQVLLSPTQYQLFKSTEPPLPSGALLQYRFYQLVERASASERQAVKGNSTSDRAR